MHDKNKLVIMILSLNSFTVTKWVLNTLFFTVCLVTSFMSFELQLQVLVCIYCHSNPITSSQDTIVGFAKGLQLAFLILILMCMTRAS